MRHVLPSLCLSALLLLAGSRLQAKEGEPEKFFDAPGATVVKTQFETVSGADVKFPSVAKRQGMSVILKFDAYLKSTTPAGWNNYLLLYLNGKPLGKSDTNGRKRLLWKTDALKHSRDEQSWWKGDMLLLLFTPGTQQVDSRVLSSKEGLYTYSFDISDIVNYLEIGADDKIEKDEGNVLKLTNTYFSKFANGAPDIKDADLVVENLQVVYVPSAVVALESKEETVKFSPSQPCATLDGGSYSATVTKGGGIHLKVGGESYYLESGCSYPTDKGIRFNTLAVGTASGGAGWAPSVAERGGVIEVEASNKLYTLKRQISKAKAGIKVKDTFTNISGADLGISVKDSMASENSFGANGSFLAGIPDAGLVKEAGSNPTAFIKGGKSGLGMVADDDLQRCQFALTRYLNILSFNNPHFGLRSGESHTFEWTIYPLVNGDYFSFLNLVRAERNLNCTIPGPFCFGVETPKSGAKIAINSIEPWYDFCSGGKFVPASDEEFKKLSLASIKKLKARDPNKIVMPKIETNSRSVDKRKLKGSEKLPVCDGKGVWLQLLDKEQTAVFTGGEFAKYDSSFLWSADKRLYLDTYYAREPYINIIAIPDGENQRYKDMIANIDFMIDDIGFDGVYLDCFEPFGVARYSYDRWDGRTVDLDANGNISKRYYDFAYTSSGARKKIIERALGKGKAVLHNIQAITGEASVPGCLMFNEMENDNVSVITMTETEPPVFRHQALCQMSVSPVILGLRPPRFTADANKHAKILMRGVISALRHGLLYYYYGFVIPTQGPGAGGYGPVNHMFPFTPVELNEGYLIGKERTITCVSGKFAWPHAEKPVCLLFDETGRDKTNSFDAVRKGNGWEVDVKLKDWNEIAVLEAASK